MAPERALHPGTRVPAGGSELPTGRGEAAGSRGWGSRGGGGMSLSLAVLLFSPRAHTGLAASGNHGWRGRPSSELCGEHVRAAGRAGCGRRPRSHRSPCSACAQRAARSQGHLPSDPVCVPNTLFGDGDISTGTSSPAPPTHVTGGSCLPGERRRRSGGREVGSLRTD